MSTTIPPTNLWRSIIANSGDAAAEIDGYTLGDGAKKKFSLAGYGIRPGGYLVLKKV